MDRSHDRSGELARTLWNVVVIALAHMAAAATWTVLLGSSTDGTTDVYSANLTQFGFDLVLGVASAVALSATAVAVARRRLPATRRTVRLFAGLPTLLAFAGFYGWQWSNGMFDRSIFDVGDSQALAAVALGAVAAAVCVGELAVVRGLPTPISKLREYLRS